MVQVEGESRFTSVCMVFVAGRGEITFEIKFEINFEIKFEIKFRQVSAED